MFEKLIEGLLLQYFGDYIENLDPNKLQLGLLSGSLSLIDIIIKPQTINKLKLPFTLHHGIIGKLFVQIPWKNNFSSPTIIKIENVEICLQLVFQENWKFIDYTSYHSKIDYLKSFFKTTINKMSTTLSSFEDKSINYLERIKIRIIDNLQINLKNIHIRIENTLQNPNVSLGFTLDELMIINTNKEWEETFINRTIANNINVFKLLTITNFGFYLNTNERVIISRKKNVEEKKIAMHNFINTNINNKKDKLSTNLFYLINPISLTAKMKQISILNLPNQSKNINIYNNKDPQTQIYIYLNQFNVDFYKMQYDSIVFLINYISQYQRFQNFKYESRKYLSYKPIDLPIKGNYIKWWKFAIKTVIKKCRFYQKNPKEFEIHPIILSKWKSIFTLLFDKYINNGKLDEEFLEKTYELPLFTKIVTLVELNKLYEWSIDSIHNYFKKNKTEEIKQQSSRGIMSYFYTSTNNNIQLTKEEENKLEEILNNLKKEENKESFYSENEIVLQIDFHLNSGWFVFTNSNINNALNSIESFSFYYKHLSFSIKKSEIFVEIETSLVDFQVEMETIAKTKLNKKRIQITLKDDKELFNPSLSLKENIELGNYIWKLNFRINNPNNPVHSSFNLHVNSINIVYNQTFLERIINFFIIKPTFDKTFANKAWEKLYEIKEKTSETIKEIILKKNIVNVNIESRKIIIPLNKYNFKHSKILIIKQGKITITNTNSIEYYSERYCADFTSINIVYLDSWEKIQQNNIDCFYIVKEMKFGAYVGVLSNKDLCEKEPIIKIEIKMNNININITERVYYSLHFFAEILKPTKQNDYWAILEQSSNDIKKNCKVIAKITKKDNTIIANQYEESIAVLSGGYIYFYDKATDENYNSYFYVKKGIVTEIKSNTNQLLNSLMLSFVLNIKNKYGDYNLMFLSEKKYLLFLKYLNETINEMNIEYESNVTSNILSSNNDLTIMSKEQYKVNEEFQSNSFQKIMFFSFEVKQLICNCIDEYDTFLFRLFILNMKFTIEIHPFDKILLFSINCIKIYDEKENENDRFYELITSESNEYQNDTLVNITIIISNSNSPLYNNSDITISIKIGYLYILWNPYVIRRLLFFFAHNEILRNKIKEEILNIPSEIKMVPIQKTKNDSIEKILQEDIFIKPTCGSSLGKYWVTISVSFRKVSMIWVQPINMLYFAKLNLDESKLNVETTIDDFHISGELGNLTIHDMTNYPYTITTLDSQLNNKDILYSKILSFNCTSSLLFDFTSYSLFCPLMKNNITSKCSVVFNSVILNYIHEYFVRLFNYIFDEFLGTLQSPPSIKEYKNKINQLPIKKTINDFEFIDLKIKFKNPQVLLKAREKFEEYFLVDLGIIECKNSYIKKQGRFRSDQLEERYDIIYHFDLYQFYLQSSNQYKILEDIVAKVDVSIPMFLNGEEIQLNDNELDKSFSIQLKVESDAIINLYQNEYSYLLKCFDLNLSYCDGQNYYYDYKQYFRNKYNALNAPNLIDNENKINNNENMIILNKQCNVLSFNLNISKIYVMFYENVTKTVFSQFSFDQLNFNYLKKISGLNDVSIIIQSAFAYNIIIKNQKELMLSSEKTFPNPLIFIKLVFDKDEEKNIIIKVSKIKLLLRSDIINILTLFFVEGIPQYSSQSLDLPNRYSPDTDTKPKLRINFEIQNILLGFPTDLLNNQEVFCLSTDLCLLYKTEKIIECKKELSDNYEIFTIKKNNAKDEEEKKCYEREIALDYKDITTINILLNNINPFVCGIKYLFNDNSINNIKNDDYTRRELMKTYKITYTKNIQIRYLSRAMFILSSTSNINANEIICKISYSDLVLLLKVIEYNFKRMDIEYDKLTKSFIRHNINNYNFNKKHNTQKEQLSFNNLQIDSSQNTIEKEMGTDKIICPSIQIIFIDNHGTTYYPFLSFRFEEVNLLNEKLSIDQSVIRASTLIKIIMYNYYLGVWEPLLENTNIELEKLNDNSDQSISKNIWYFDIKNRNEGKTPSNINISDMTITFLFSTLKLWIDKYFQLKANYNVEAKKILQDKPKTISNHTVVNLSGRPMTIYWVLTDKEIKINQNQNVEYKVIALIKPNQSYNIEYIEHNDISICNNKPFAWKKREEKKYIAFSFDLIDINQITSNSIKIDEVQLKEHSVNYTLIISKYSLPLIELLRWQYLLSEVKIIDMKKRITIYSPLIIVNKLNLPINIIVKQNLLKQEETIFSMQQNGIPFEYLDGTLEFSFHNNKADIKPSVFKITTFFDNNFTQTEIKLNNSYVRLFRAVFQINKLNYIRIILSPPYILRNHLPFSLNLIVKGQNIEIKKASKECFYSISLSNKFLCESIKCLHFESKKHCFIELFNHSNIKNNNITEVLNSNGSNVSYIFYLFDVKGSAIQILSTVIQSKTSIVIVLHTSGLIFNSTLLPLKFFYDVEGEKFEIPGQSIETNVLMISNHKKMIVELSEKEPYTSKSIPLNAIGLITNFECSPMKNKRKNISFSYLYEFTLETSISLIADDLNIFTLIATIHPKYIITNKTNNAMYISNTNMKLEPLIIPPLLSKPFFCSYKDKHDSSQNVTNYINDIILMIRPIQEADKYKSGSKWNWSYPVNFKQTSFITSQITSIHPSNEKKYINIEQKVQEYSTFIILTHTNYSTSRFVIENYSYYISMRISQVDYEQGSEYINLRSKAIFTLSNAHHKSKKIKIEFVYGKYNISPILYTKVYSLTQIQFPYIEEIILQKNIYSGHKTKLEITTNGVKIIIRILDDAFEYKAEDIRMDPFPNSKNLFSYGTKHGEKETIFVHEINVKIQQIGLSVINDNKNMMTKMNLYYHRNEIFYVTLYGIQIFYHFEKANIAKCSSWEFQCKINSLQIDNEYNYITLYPVIFKPVLAEEIKGKELPPFFNIAMSCYLLGEDETEPIKFSYFNYLIQSFHISIDNEILEALINFSINVNMQLKSSFTQIHRLLYETSKNNNENYFRPDWVDSDNISSDKSKIFFEVLETSSIEMITSFKVGEVIEKYITTNPILGTICSAFTNMEKADLRLNGCEMRNLYYSPINIIQIVFNQYKQSILTQIISIVGAIDLLGSPCNLFKSLGTGVKDFFTMPMEGIIKGPLEGVEGAIEGGYSLLKNTIGGACLATSKIATGISTSLLHLNKDKKYLKKIENDILLLKPNNFVEGFGYGITSLANGVFSGLCDVVVKPIEETQKNGITGFGKGLFKGIGGFFSKPVIGLLQLVSNTTEGIKNTISSDDYNWKQIRLPRPFYGKYKYIQSYNSFHAHVLWFIKIYIEEINKNTYFCFYDAEYYENKRNEPFYIIFNLKEMLIIDKNKKEVKISLFYSVIKDVYFDKNSLEIKLCFNQKWNGKENVVLYLFKGTANAEVIVNKIKKNIKDSIGMFQ